MKNLTLTLSLTLLTMVGMAQSKHPKSLLIYHWTKVDTINKYDKYTEIIWHKKGTIFRTKLKPNEIYKIDTVNVFNQF
jgi:hypothetical protein